MRILVTGGSGLIGSHLIPFLEGEGYDVDSLVRNRAKSDDKHLFWDPEKDILETQLIENYDVIIHLAGENISSRRWSVKQKDKILQSRIKSTRLLVGKINELTNPPRLFISASAIGYYGDRGEELLTEKSENGEGFLAEVVKKWEHITSLLQNSNIQRVFLRSGVVLSKRGGALAKVLLPFKFGMGAIIGNGSQYVSWISIEDIIRAIDYIIRTEDISGPVNLVAPEPVTNFQYSKSLGKALSRPVIFKVPIFVLRLVLGDMADALLLASNRVIPQKLTDHGYKFLHPTIDQAFNSIFIKNS